MKKEPKFNYGDIVSFDLKVSKKTRKLTGYIYVVDAFGTFDCPDEVSYDIVCPRENCLYKHIKEVNVTGLVMKCPMDYRSIKDKEFLPRLIDYLSNNTEEHKEYLIENTKNLLKYQEFIGEK